MYARRFARIVCLICNSAHFTVTIVRVDFLFKFKDILQTVFHIFTNFYFIHIAKYIDCNKHKYASANEMKRQKLCYAFECMARERHSGGVPH